MVSYIQAPVGHDAYLVYTANMPNAIYSPITNMPSSVRTCAAESRILHVLRRIISGTTKCADVMHTEFKRDLLHDLHLAVNFRRQCDAVTA